MGWKLLEMLEDGGRHAATIAGWIGTRRPGRGVDHRGDGQRQRERAYVERLHPERMRLRVAEVIEESPTTRTIRCTRVDGPLPPFRAGQFVSVVVEVDGVLTSRPYSVSSAPGVDHLDLTVRELPGGFVSPRVARMLRPGDELDTTGPEGHFYVEPLIDGDHLVFLAGGTGITPFASIIRQAAADGWPRHITLLYGCRTPEEQLFAEEFAGYAAATDRFHLVVVLSEPPPGTTGPTGFLDRRLIAAHAQPLDGRVFFVCGPRPMTALCVAELEALGVPRHKVRQELQGAPEDVTRLSGWPGDVPAEASFTLTVGERQVPAVAGESLLVALERAGVTATAVCRSGECGACRLRLLDGRVFALPWAAVRESDRRLGFVHACACHPLSDLRVAP